MKRDEFLLRFKAMQADDLLLMERKNADYANKTDALSNLKDFGFFGAVVRIGDKYHRLKNFAWKWIAEKVLKIFHIPCPKFLKKKLMVEDEKIEQTISDMRVYLIIAELLLEDENEKT